MKHPWEGDQKPPSAGMMEKAAGQLSINVALMRAVAITEGSGRYYDKNGVLSRFEPHKMPDSPLNWRDSLKIKPTDRRYMFMAAYALKPESALRASSWGAFQIMGFNHKATGYPDAHGMVVAMARSADSQTNMFVAMAESTGAATHLRSGDALGFATIWNGTGQARVYAARIKANTLLKVATKELGAPLHAVIRMGSKGAAVKVLQKALDLPVDGNFGPATRARVVLFQGQQGLTTDGIVGHKTWVALQVDKVPVQKPDNWCVVLFNLIMERFEK